MKNVRHVRTHSEMEKFTARYTNNAHTRKIVCIYTYTHMYMYIYALALERIRYNFCSDTCVSRELLSVTHRHHVLHMRSLIDSN